MVSKLACSSLTLSEKTPSGFVNASASTPNAVDAMTSSENFDIISFVSNSKPLSANSSKCTANFSPIYKRNVSH